MGIRLKGAILTEIREMAEMWQIAESASARRFIMAGRDALLTEKTSSPRLALLAHKLEQLDPDNRAKAEVLLRILEREVSELLSSQSSAS